MLEGARIAEIKSFLEHPNPGIREVGVQALPLALEHNFGITSLEGMLDAVSAKVGNDTEVQSAVVRYWGRNHTRDAERFLSSRENAQRYPTTVAQVAGRIARGDPMDAADWVVSLESASGIRVVADLWMAVDSIAASRWVANLPEGEMRDSGAIPVALRLLRANRPDEAAAWINSITNNKERINLKRRAGIE